MKHAVILLSSYGKGYLENAVSQFRNDKRFDIYIHLDDKSNTYDDTEKNVFMNKFSNVVWMDHLYDCKRFTIELAYIMADMLEIAWKSNVEYNFFHLFSDTCKIVVPLEKFFTWFQTVGFKHDYIVKYLDKDIDSICFPDLHKASQWQTFSNKFVDYFFKNDLKEKTKNLPQIKTMMEYIVNSIASGRNNLQGSMDEFFFPTAFEILMKDAELSHLNQDLRFTCWYDDGIEILNKNHDFSRPMTLSVAIRPKTYLIEMIQRIKKDGYLIARKFDYTDNNSREFFKLLNKLC